MLNRLGYRTDVVGNGNEALNALKLLPYELVLTDVQMPEIDGLEATRRFRALEAGAGRHMPILAMAAHASLSDRDRCLNAGMDDFVTKPVQREVLGRIIAANLKKRRSETPMSKLPDPKAFDSKHIDAEHMTIADAVAQSASQREAQAGDTSATAVSDGRMRQDAVADAATQGADGGFTLDVMIQRLDNDEEIAREIAEIFVVSSEELLAELVTAVADGQADVIRARAHSIKGSAGNIGADAVLDFAASMEDAARDGDLAQASQLLGPLKRALEEVNRILSAWS